MNISMGHGIGSCSSIGQICEPIVKFITDQVSSRHVESTAYGGLTLGANHKNFNQPSRHCFSNAITAQVENAKVVQIAAEVSHAVQCFSAVVATGPLRTPESLTKAADDLGAMTERATTVAEVTHALQLLDQAIFTSQVLTNSVLFVCDSYLHSDSELANATILGPQP